MKGRWAFLIVGAAALALGAAGVVRELSVPSPGAGDRAAPSALAVTPGTWEAGAARSLPDLRFVDAAGRSGSVQDLRGRFILLNVWATWCTPCRKEMPSLDRLQQVLGGPDFEVVALSIDRGGSFAVAAFYEDLDIRALRVYVDPSTEALTKLGALGIPLTLLVDRSGRELWRVAGPVRWDDPQVVARIRTYLGAPRNS
jgi:thiol-disulfide isomerase/thioredoxin